MRILDHLRPLGLFALRLGLAAVFAASGYDKLFRAPAKWLAWFHQHGFPPYFAYIAGALELFGAILLVLGLMTRLAGLLLAIEMGIAVVKVSLPHSGIYKRRWLRPSCLFWVWLGFALATTGAGLLSIDAATFERGGGGSKSRAKSKA